MRVLIVDSYYPAFVHTVYEQCRNLHKRPYAEQWRTLMDQCFGTADFYSTNLTRLGHEAKEVIANCELLQRRWAREHGLRLGETTKWPLIDRVKNLPWLRRAQGEDWFYGVLAAQVEEYRPDVLYVQDMNGISAEFLGQMKAHAGAIVGQIAYAMRRDADFRVYDLVVSSLPHYVRNFREQGLHSEYFRLGFGEQVLARLTGSGERCPVSHIGGYGGVHRERDELLEALIVQGMPLTCWGYGVQQLPPSSPIHRCYRGEAWGVDMYRIRANSQIAISKHISSVAGEHANIMTMYEATGVGTLLLIDSRIDLDACFEPGSEVIAYRSSDECADSIRYYLEHEEERQAIARAGQRRTLRDHTYDVRMQELVGILGRFL